VSGNLPISTWRLLRAGGFRLDGGGMFGIIPRSMWARWMPPDADNRIGLAMNCVLVERAGEGGGGRVRRTLVEAGAGGKWTDKEQAIYEFERAADGRVRTIEHALAEIGVDPASIDDVVLTHLHFDHAGGLTRLAADGTPELVFPKARIHVQRQEWNDALANRSTMTRTYLRTHIDPIADRLELHQGEAEIVAGVRVMPAAGHTWGHQVVVWRDAEGTVCYPGDVMPTIHHAHLSASLGYDMLPYQTMLTKRALLELADQESWRLVLDHQPGECVARRGRRF
jgi:glyoxylase-like metal-dependent hydrolase (beta-lactamase superfamily II)